MMTKSIEAGKSARRDCPEEAAFRNGFLLLAQLEEHTNKMPKCEYREYLEKEVIAESRRLAAIHA